MTILGNGLSDAGHHEDALAVKEAELSMMRRLDASEEDVLIVQSNLAKTYFSLGRFEEALRMRRDVYFGFLKLHGEESIETLTSAYNYADSLVNLERFEEARSLLRKAIPVAQRVLGKCHELTLKLRYNYARALHEDGDATLDDLREAVTTLEDTERIARRVFGGAPSLTRGIELELEDARAALRARETPPPPGHSRDPSAADDDATPPAPAAFADSSPEGSSGEAPATAACDAEAPSS